jgi:uncharacterized RDD family membrane protein YckC
MTEGGSGYGDQYRDQYGEQSAQQSGQQPAPPAPPWADPAGQQQPTQQWGGPAQPNQPTQQWPQQPYAQPYGQPYGQPYAQPQYGGYQQNPWGTPPPGWGGPRADLASWGARAGAVLLDGLFAFLIFIPCLVLIGITVAAADTTTNPDGTVTTTNVSGTLVGLTVLLGIAGVVWALWNQGWRQGSQGWSWGKQVVGIKLVRESTGQPPGGWTGIGRLFLRNVLGNVTFGIYTLLTYLWPLWDDKNQSLDDKMLSTLVVRAR